MEALKLSFFRHLGQWPGIRDGGWLERSHRNGSYRRIPEINLQVYSICKFCAIGKVCPGRHMTNHLTHGPQFTLTAKSECHLHLHLHVDISTCFSGQPRTLLS